MDIRRAKEVIDCALWFGSSKRDHDVQLGENFYYSVSFPQHILHGGLIVFTRDLQPAKAFFWLDII